MTPTWLTKARSYLGLKEYPGAKTNPTIGGWLARLKAAWREDETPWCGTFCAEVFTEVGISPPSGWAGARNWMNFGLRLAAPTLGAVVVFWRDSPKSGKGHVGFVAGKDQAGRLMVLAGNQGDAVTIKPFGYDRVLGYRWPASQTMPSLVGLDSLPVIRSDGKLSTQEA